MANQGIPPAVHKTSLKEMWTQNPDQVFKIMVATDNHLGYKEDDPIRGEDSFNSFEEILQHAVKNQVDFILLGGDLFHDTTPSHNSLNKCMRMLRDYTTGGDTRIKFQVCSDKSIFKDCYNSSVNYEDPNMKVSIPVFSIHGNHDDPAKKDLSVLDVLATSGLVNYFGKQTNLNDGFEIHPILMKKEMTQLAIFGLSHIPDRHLKELIRDNKVKMNPVDTALGEFL